MEQVLRFVDCGGLLFENTPFEQPIQSTMAQLYNRLIGENQWLEAAFKCGLIFLSSVIGALQYVVLPMPAILMSSFRSYFRKSRLL